MSKIEEALAIALEAHKGQVDKAGKPYILHPLRVMSKFKRSPTRQIVAVLHDVVEDSTVTLNDLVSKGFSSRVIEALEALTHKVGEDYDAYIGRVLTNRIAISIKIADLQDNMDLSRIPCPTPKDMLRQEKYKKAHERLWNSVWKSVRLRDSMKALRLEKDITDD